MEMGDGLLESMTMDESRGSSSVEGVTIANAEIFEAVRRVAWVVASATIPRD